MEFQLLPTTPRLSAAQTALCRLGHPEIPNMLNTWLHTSTLVSIEKDRVTLRAEEGIARFSCAREEDLPQFWTTLLGPDIAVDYLKANEGKDQISIRRKQPDRSYDYKGELFTHWTRDELVSSGQLDGVYRVALAPFDSDSGLILAEDDYIERTSGGFCQIKTMFEPVTESYRRKLTPKELVPDQRDLASLPRNALVAVLGRCCRLGFHLLEQPPRQSVVDVVLAVEQAASGIILPVPLEKLAEDLYQEIANEFEDQMEGLPAFYAARAAAMPGSSADIAQSAGACITSVCNSAIRHGLPAIVSNIADDVKLLRDLSEKEQWNDLTPVFPSTFPSTT